MGSNPRPAAWGRGLGSHLPVIHALSGPSVALATLARTAGDNPPWGGARRPAAAESRVADTWGLLASAPVVIPERLPQELVIGLQPHRASREIFDETQVAGSSLFQRVPHVICEDTIEQF